MRGNVTTKAQRNIKQCSVKLTIFFVNLRQEVRIQHMAEEGLEVHFVLLQNILHCTSGTPGFRSITERIGG